MEIFKIRVEFNLNNLNLFPTANRLYWIYVKIFHDLGFLQTTLNHSFFIFVVVIIVIFIALAVPYFTHGLLPVWFSYFFSICFLSVRQVRLKSSNINGTSVWLIELKEKHQSSWKKTLVLQCSSSSPKLCASCRSPSPPPSANPATSNPDHL